MVLVLLGMMGLILLLVRMGVWRLLQRLVWGILLLLLLLLSGVL